MVGFTDIGGCFVRVSTSLVSLVSLASNAIHFPVAPHQAWASRRVTVFDRCLAAA